MAFDLYDRFSVKGALNTLNAIQTLQYSIEESISVDTLVATFSKEGTPEQRGLYRDLFHEFYYGSEYGRAEEYEAIFEERLCDKIDMPTLPDEEVFEKGEFVQPGDLARFEPKELADSLINIAAQIDRRMNQAVHFINYLDEAADYVDSAEDWNKFCNEDDDYNDDDYDDEEEGDEDDEEDY